MTRHQFLISLPVISSLSHAAEHKRKAPELSLLTIDGQRLQLSALRGKVVLIEFMLTSCPHCQRTARMLSNIERELGSKGLKVISVAFNDDARTEAPRFVREHVITHAVATLNREAVYDFAQLSVVMRHTVPILVLVDRQGIIRAQYEGDAPFFQNEEVNVRTLLARYLPGQVSRVSSDSIPQPVNRRITQF